MKIFRLAGILIFIAIILCLLAVGGIIFIGFLNSPSEDIPADGVLFEIKDSNSESPDFDWESGEHIILRLEKEKLIRSGLFLRIYSKLTGTESSFKKGMYRIKPSYTTLDIHDLLISGREELQKITIPEGWTATRIASYFQEKGFVSAKNFMSMVKSKAILDKYQIPAKSAEGYLFPDTYFFPKNSSAESIVTKMIDTFFLKTEDYMIRETPLTPAALQKAVIMASIVEREYRSKEEAPLIASVFYNRLKQSIPLESCATVAYIISEIKGKPYPKRIYYADLEINSEYNTYKNYGLPPGPICNPGLTAIIASLAPAETSYLYFVLKNPESGEHEFSNSFGQHTAAKQLYIKTD